MFLLRLVLIALSLLGPQVGAASPTLLAEDECDEFVHDVAVELRAVACQPPLPRTPSSSAARRPRGRARRRNVRVAALGRRRPARARLRRRLLYADGDDPDEA